MLKLTIVVKKFETKAKKTFFKATAKGKYIPSVEVDDETYYTIKLHKPSKDGKSSEPIEVPQREGFYEVGIPSKKDLWLDTRAEMLGKNIFHVRASKIIFVENLPVNVEK